MKQPILGLLFIIVTFGFSGCSDKDEIPTDADDNFITSVSFTVDSKNYDAVIADNVITITVPYTVSLNKASASFQYTSSAKVYPDPATITDWDNERIFRVMSYNGKENKYTYKVIKDDIYEDGDVLLKNTAELTAFAKKGVTVVKGNLIIGTDDGEDIENITALEKLKQVEGVVIIKNSYKGTDLTGLDNLTSMGGLQIGAKTAFSTSPVYQVSFRSLEAITGDMAIYNDNTKWLMGESLTTAGGNIAIYSASLQSIQLDKLNSVGGDFSIQCADSKNEGNMGGTMVSLSLPELLSVKGTLSTKYLASLKSIELPKLSVAGSILFESLPMALDKINLSDIKAVDGDLKITSYTVYTPIGSVTTGNQILKGFEGFGKLEKIGGMLELSYFTAVTEVPNVSQVSIGGYYLDHMESVQPIFDFSKTVFLKKGDKECEVKLAYTPVNQIVGRQSMDCIINLEKCDVTNGMPVLKNIEVLKGFMLYVGKDTGTENENILELDLKQVTGNIFIDTHLMGDKRAIYKLPNIESVGGYFWINDGGGDLPDLIAPNLSSIGGQFVFSGDTDALFSLWKAVGKVDLSNLKTVGCADEVQYLTTDYYGNKIEDGIPTFSLTFGKDGYNAVLPALQKVGGRGMRIGLYAINEGITFSCQSLSTVEGRLLMTGAPKPGADWADPFLNTLTFPALKQAGGVRVERFGSLNDFSTFAPLFEGNVITKSEDWSVEDCGYNPTFDDMKAGKYK